MSIGNLPESFESSNVSRDNVSREIGRMPRRILPGVPARRCMCSSVHFWFHLMGQHMTQTTRRQHRREKETNTPPKQKKTTTNKHDLGGITCLKLRSVVLLFVIVYLFAYVCLLSLCYVTCLKLLV